jgi:hypothetical protein
VKCLIAMNRVLVFFISFSLLSFGGSARAETVGEALREACPKAYAMEKSADRAMHLADKSHYALYKQAAGLFYDCYQNITDNSSLRDYVHVEYIWDLFDSSDGPSENNREIYQTVSIEANALGGSTKVPSVKKDAAKLLGLSNQALEILNGVQNYPIVPVVTATPQPQIR